MTLDLRFHPLTEWPAAATPVDQRKSKYTFRSRWDSTLELLELELGHLKATDVIISAGLRPEDILSFASKHGPLRYLTDRYDGWKANVRAIALGLEALRAVDRYGITERGEQYVGWKAIPASTTSRADSKALLFSVAGEASPSALDEKTVYRKALIAAHPDHGGSRELLEQVQDAGRKLGVA